MSENDVHGTQYQEGPADPDEQIPRNNNSDNNEHMYDASYKVILLGDSGVGKSNLLARFTKGVFLPHTKPTVGVEFASKTVQMENNKLVRAQIWDTAGQERYRLIASSYYRRALGALLVYDVTNRNSFDNLLKWLREVEEVADEDCLVMLVGNKIDLHRQTRAVSLQDGRDFAMRHKVAFIETSAKDDIGVDASFQHLLQAIYNLQGNKQRMKILHTSKNGKNGSSAQGGDSGFKLSPTEEEKRQLNKDRSLDGSRSPWQNPGCCGA
jgi:small GTP-binding protein